jgi:hypothetical protein
VLVSRCWMLVRLVLRPSVGPLPALEVLDIVSWWLEPWAACFGTHWACGMLSREGLCRMTRESVGWPKDDRRLPTSFQKMSKRGVWVLRKAARALMY